jgi:hypothetical protein
VPVRPTKRQATCTRKVLALSELVVASPDGYAGPYTGQSRRSGSREISMVERRVANALTRVRFPHTAPLFPVPTVSHLTT